jgi:hypothetical protein
MDDDPLPPSNQEFFTMLNKILSALDYAIEKEVFSLKYNLTYIIRYLKTAFKNIYLLIYIDILFSINPRKKLLKRIKKEFLARSNTGTIKKVYLKPILLKELYERNML